MLGVPSSLGVAGLLALVLGIVGGLCAVIMVRRRLRSLGLVEASAALSLLVVASSIPYVGWRFAEDLRLTTKLHGYDAAAAGPVQAFLPGYLVDGAQNVIPKNATYSVVVASDVPWPSARLAFPSLAMQTLFPRVSVSDPRVADYLVTWGIAPRRVAPVTETWVVRRQFGMYPAVRVGRVRR
jgi:hypothetical protein